MKYDYDIDLNSNSSHAQILKSITPGSVVLEFGSATGYMTKYMKENLECKVYCVEIDPGAAEKAKVYAEQMIIGDIEDFDWKDQYKDITFDYIIFADVLEHLRDPWTVLQTASKLLSEEGKVITSIPNIGHIAVILELLQGKFDYRQIGLLDNTHLRFFTRKSVLDLLESASLEPIEWKSTYCSPEQTEFAQTIQGLPYEVQSYFKNKEDAFIYQFITVSKLKQEVSERGHSTEQVPQELYNEFLQVFWSVNNTYSEEASEKFSVYGNDHILLDINVPRQHEGDIRLDLTNFPAYIEIKQISLLLNKEDGSVDNVKHWLNFNSYNGYSEMLKVQGFVHYIQEIPYKLICFDEDVQLYVLDVPSLEKDCSYILRVELNIERNYKAILLNELLSVANQMQLKNMEIESKSIMLETLQQSNIALQQKLEDGRKELDNLVKELSIKTQRVDDLEEELSIKTQQVDRILNSKSWKLTSTFRWISQKIRQALNSFKSLQPNLLPVHGLKQVNPYQWEAINDDPHFLLEGDLPTEWVLIRWKAGSKIPIRFDLYFDLGNGFNERDIIHLGTIVEELPTNGEAVIYLPRDVRKLRLDTGNVPTVFRLEDFSIKKITRLSVFMHGVRNFKQLKGMTNKDILSLSARAWDIMRTEGLRSLWLKAKKHASAQTPDSAAGQMDYRLWVKLNQLTNEDKIRISREIVDFKYKPLISVILPVYNVEEKWLRKCIDSVINQLYPNWELCIADDASPKTHIRTVLEEYIKKDKRIKVVFREKNGHISEASNSAIEIATGEFIALLDHDDELTPDALYENVKLLNKHPEADMIYSDEDKITEDGERHSPFFKPDWSPDTILSMMYTCHLGVYRTSIVKKIGGFRKGYEGSQDHDLVLRFTEKTNNIYHIPKILYHWRTIAESTAMNAGTKSYAHQAGLKAVRDAVERRGEKAIVESVGNYAGRYQVNYLLPEIPPLISIIIPTKDKAELLSSCIESIFTKTTYQNFEVIIVDNNSEEEETIKLLDQWKNKEPKRFRVLRLEIPFNYSKLNNEAVKQANGELILLLNNDIEVISPNWLERMAGQAIRENVGAVGAKLLYEDNTIQHAGVILGVGGIANHSHRGFEKDSPGYFGWTISTVNYSAVTAACLMVKKSVFNEVTGLEEKLEVAFNDVDFCLKVLQKGYYNIFLSDVHLYHYESKSRGLEDTPEKRVRFMGEIQFMKERWGDLLVNDPFYNPNLTLDREDFSLRFD